MPRIFDNIKLDLLPALKNSLANAYRADFCVGYFNLRGWNNIADAIELLAGGEHHHCRLLIGMQQHPYQSLIELHGLIKNEKPISQEQVNPLKKQFAEEFRQQLTIGSPSNQDERTLRILAQQLEAKKLIVKLFLRHPLHAKLYLTFRRDHDNPITGYLGSSNLTLAGLLKQGELNIA